MKPPAQAAAWGSTGWAATARAHGAGRRGVALPLLLFCLLVLTALATIAIQAALQEVVVSRAALRLLQARVTAESGIRMATGSVTRVGLLTLERGTPEELIREELEPNGRFTVQGHRLRGDFFMLEGTGTASGREPGEARVGRLFWVLDPVRELGSYRGVMEHAGGAPAEGIDGGAIRTAPDEWPPSVCSDFRADLDALFPFGDHPATASLADAAAPGAADGPPPLGILQLPDLHPMADRLVEGVWSPGPHFSAGSCSSSLASNWGAPANPEGPCGGHLPLIVSPGSLHVAGGEGQGVLVVADDLELSGTAYFAGVVLVGGDVTLSDQARVDGVMRVRGSIRLTPGATIRGSGCAALRALDGPAAFRGIFPVSGGSWVGMF